VLTASCCIDRVKPSLFYVMGCAESKKSREDTPMQGKDYEFIVKANGVMSGNFTAYSSEQEPWLKFDHTANFDNQGGVMSVSKAYVPDGGNGGERLLTVKISDVNFNETEASHQDYHGWFDSDRTTKMAWSISRKVEVFEGENGKPLATLDIEYFGVAEARKSTERGNSYDSDFDSNTHWDSKANTFKADVSLMIGDSTCALQHHWFDPNRNPLGGGFQMWSSFGDIPWAQDYKVTGGPDFGFIYKDQWGIDETVVNAGPDSPPVVAAALGFMISYWLHPTRVEDDAAKLAMKVLSDRLGWFG